MSPADLMFPNVAAVEAIVRVALAEDVGPGDITSAATLPAGTRATATFVAREPGGHLGAVLMEVGPRRFAAVHIIVRFAKLLA